jgi:hypothetical protein
MEDPWRVQRLFSMFPRGAPGTALVVLRLAVAATSWTAAPAACLPAVWMSLVQPVLSILLALGLLTPAVAVVCAAMHGVGLACGAAGPVVPAAVAVANAVALALLGPGAYSFDCRFFGRRVFVVSAGGGSP